MIYQDQRAFGHDNLKTWHVHPFNASNTHLPCEEPSMEQIFIEMNGIRDRLTEGNSLKFAILKQQTTNGGRKDAGNYKYNKDPVRDNG